MKKFEMHPIVSSALQDVASYIQRWHGDQGENLSIQHLESYLHWLLLESPLHTDASQHGYCVRDSAGAIRGLNLNFPSAFLAGDQRLLGLCSASFLVEPEAKGSGSFLFMRYMGSPGYRFFFATTCNANSSPIWARMRGVQPPNSEIEYILPLKLDSMLPALLTQRTSNRLVSGIGRTLGVCANPIMQVLARNSGRLTTEPCLDWEKLSELFQRHRLSNLITTERSAVYLQWRYGPTSPNHDSDIYLFRDKCGNEGWFSLANVFRGSNRNVRGCVVLDVVWPREKITFRDIVSAILQRVPAGTDAVCFRPRPGLDYAECGQWIMPHKLEAPAVWAVGRKGDSSLDLSLLDLVFTDGDSACWFQHQSDKPSPLERLSNAVNMV
jgi:hypothetical protein